MELRRVPPEREQYSKEKLTRSLQAFSEGFQICYAQPACKILDIIGDNGCHCEAAFLPLKQSPKGQFPWHQRPGQVCPF
jgi:hypothetical protein